VQRVEADTVGAQAGGKLDQSLEVGEIPDPPVARRPDTIELYGH
jgi:hypothetical protein